MGSMWATRDLFLWCMSAIYLFAFSSLYIQIPGLYGDNGILPARLVAPKEANSLHDLTTGSPTLLRFMPRLGLSIQRGMDLLALVGTALAFISLVAKPLRNSMIYAALWGLYLSLFQVGQTFLWFQWDILLLEAGFLTILVAPLNLYIRRKAWYPHDGITFWLIKWLLFRLMFASGVVKLTSRCPTWWGLTALNWHYESQCIPTPLAWYFHQLPDWFQRLSVVAVYLIEIPIPFMFFSPVRSMRLFAFFTQILLQILIIFTGNYNFFNLLTVTLCLPLVDDQFIGRNRGNRGTNANYPGTLGRLQGVLRVLFNLLVYGALIFFSVRLFKLKFSFSPFQIKSTVAFGLKDFDRFLEKTVPLSIWLGVLCLAWEILNALFQSMFRERGFFGKLASLIGTVVFGIAAIGMFTVSLVPHVKILESAQKDLPSRVKEIYLLARPYKLSSSYGLFRRMTGVGGRPEVIIEGSNSIDSGWKEYNFLYKPGNLSAMPPVVAPHQPRLDWQMWFAALGSYQHNPWFLYTIHRIFEGQKEVMELMGENPFPNKPPKYLRATLYHYHYTSMNEKHKWYSATDWWVREKQNEYFPIITKDDPNFVAYLKQAGVLQAAKRDNSKPGLLLWMITRCRSIVGQMEGFTFVISLFFTALALHFLGLASQQKHHAR